MSNLSVFDERSEWELVQINWENRTEVYTCSDYPRVYIKVTVPKQYSISELGTTLRLVHISNWEEKILVQVIYDKILDKRWYL